mgnify:CR=1 FL=1
MNLKTFLVPLYFTLFCSVWGISQNEELESIIQYKNHTYQPQIQTVQLHLLGDPLAPPILELGDNKQIQLNFDNLNSELRDFYYTFIHCDANWNPSDLMPNEYINGLNEDLIFDHDFSRNTIHSYINYRVAFPNDEMRITNSGNYLLYVFEDGDRKKPVLTYRFMVVEPKTNLAAKIFSGSGGYERNLKQAINIRLSSNEYQLTNPYEDLKVFILQNQRWDNMIGPITPAFVKGNEIEYGIGNEAVFDGGNEYRYFNIQDLNFLGKGIKQHGKDERGYHHVFLEEEQKRTYQVYLTSRDINGKYFIRNTQWGDNPDIDADYAYVHFNLKADQPFGNDIFVSGQLTNWQLDPRYKMKYDHDRKLYEGVFLLKQGQYNYQYVMEDKDGFGINLEGSHFDTENDYYILVYHRNMVDRFDRLIGLKLINSKRDF